MQDHVVGLGSLAQTRARTPRVFRWGMRRNKHVLLSVRVSAHAKGHAPPKHSGVLAFLAPDRTPRVSSGPEWAARESTQPARGTPCATGLACQRGTRASGGRVVRATPRRSESLPPGALGGVLMVESREGKGAGQAPTKVDGNRSPHEVCAGRLTRNAKNSQATDSRVLGGHPPRFHLQSIFGRGVKLILHPCSFYGKGETVIQKSRTRFEAAIEKNLARNAAEAAGEVADSHAVRLAIMARVHSGEITLAQAQSELKKIQAKAQSIGLITRQQAFSRG